MKTIKKTVILKKRIINFDFDNFNQDILYLLNEINQEKKEKLKIKQ